ncbi:MAG: hypothetical protein WCT49_05750 [Candidatus Paceibacterota bacterium]
MKTYLLIGAFLSGLTAFLDPAHFWLWLFVCIAYLVGFWAEISPAGVDKPRYPH